ncbi:hypothetical protein LIX60_03875 [Streptomyces sp. S07_1.15]|uniref:hypothetical protein n=1 Tax=Streptomyces sp. S07_1.15 TaxID=2873925 RepID=UPI001D15646E|nr:hypothetical protein [Streptomyces sp. S07_1.15]MCC3650642.1 hypothetical protein [Streptomyces sp. S07_1.15]
MIRTDGGAMVFEAGNNAKKADGSHVMNDPLHRGPYVKIQQGKKKPIRIPLAGNPTLD